MKVYDVEGDSLQEILSHFAKENNVTVESLQYEVIDAGSKGILGFGKRPMKLRITLSNKQNDASSRNKRYDSDDKYSNYEEEDNTPKLPNNTDYKGLLRGLLDRMGFEEASIEEKTDDKGRIVLNIDCDSPEAIIGRSAQNLDSIQYVFDKMVNKPGLEELDIIVDVLDYRKNKVESTVEKAIGFAKKVQKTGKSIKLLPMVSIIRKEVHIALKEIPGISTVSHGDGQLKEITIMSDRNRYNKKRYNNHSGGNRYNRNNNRSKYYRGDN